MISTHVLNRGGKRVTSPLDDLSKRSDGVLYRNCISIVSSIYSALHFTSLYSLDYADLNTDVLCREFAAQGCYKETI